MAAPIQIITLVSNGWRRKPWLLLFLCSISQLLSTHSAAQAMSTTKIKNVLEFGAKGDGISDDTKAIQNALDAIDNMGGGTLVLPTVAATYAVSETLFIGNNTKVIFERSFVKLVHETSIGTVFFNKKQASNIEVINPLIDGNNIYAVFISMLLFLFIR